MLRSLLTPAVLVALACALLGCQLLVKLDKHQCESDAFCVELLGEDFACNSAGVCESTYDPDAGPKLPAHWACLDNNLSTSDFTVATGADSTLMMDLIALDHATRAVNMETVARSCRADDPSCDDPIEDQLTPDAEGYIHFQSLPVPFSGHMEFEIPGLLPLHFSINRPVLSDYKGFAGASISLATQMGLADRALDDVDFESGSVIMLLSDCNGDPAVDVRVIQPDGLGSKAFYFDGPFPDQGLESSVISTSISDDGSPLAVGGFFNLPAGPVALEVRLAETDHLVSSFKVNIRNESISAVKVLPGNYGDE